MASITIDSDKVTEVLSDLRTETRRETMETIAKGLRSGAVEDSKDNGLWRRILFAIRALFSKGTPNSRAWNTAADVIEAAITARATAIETGEHLKG